MAKLASSLDDFTAVELEVYADGESVPQIADFLDQHPVIRRQWLSEQQKFSQLKSHLFRFECLLPEQLQDYHWNDLPDAEKRTMQSHLNLCPWCAQELETLRKYAAADSNPVQSPTSVIDRAHDIRDRIQATFDQVRMVVATLIAPANPQFALAGLRGEKSAVESSAIGAQTTSIYEFEETTLSLTIQRQDSDQKTLFGQVLTPFSTENRILTLIPANPNQPEITTVLDSIGNFVFANLAASEYQMFVFMDEQTIVIPNLNLG